MAAFSTGYPNGGSFSRSALNSSWGGRTLASKATTIVVIVMCLTYLTPYFFFIPTAVLTAIIWMAIWDMIFLSDLWTAWKHCKKDFLVMLFSLIFTFVYDTKTGLVVGIAASLFFSLYDYIILEHGPKASYLDVTDREVTVVIDIRGTVNFFTCPLIFDIIARYSYRKPQLSVVAMRQERLFFQITTFLDRLLRPPRKEKVERLPNWCVYL